MIIPEDVLHKYRRAGKIAAKVREEARRTVREGMFIIDLCDRVESMIRCMGGEPAFPCNISVNEIAAHYTSPPKDKRRIPENSIVKIDLGVHVDGYIADTAVTVCFNSKYESLVQVAEEALRKAVEILRPGLLMSRFGSIIQKTIKNRGLKPVSNLTGHNIERYLIHGGKSLPNVFNVSIARVKAGEVYGVEPFVTTSDGVGKVKSDLDAYIFRFLKRRSLKNPYAKRLLNYIREYFRSLPFTERWLTGQVPHDRYKHAFSELLSSKSLTSYPVLTETSGKPVAQAEHTVLIVKNGCEVLT